MTDGAGPPPPPSFCRRRRAAGGRALCPPRRMLRRLFPLTQGDGRARLRLRAPTDAAGPKSGRWKARLVDGGCGRCEALWQPGPGAAGGAAEGRARARRGGVWGARGARVRRGLGGGRTTLLLLLGLHPPFRSRAPLARCRGYDSHRRRGFVFLLFVCCNLTSLARGSHASLWIIMSEERGSSCEGSC